MLMNKKLVSHSMHGLYICFLCLEFNFHKTPWFGRNSHWGLCAILKRPKCQVFILCSTCRVIKVFFFFFLISMKLTFFLPSSRLHRKKLVQFVCYMHESEMKWEMSWEGLSHIKFLNECVHKFWFRCDTILFKIQLMIFLLFRVKKKFYRNS